MTWGWLKYAALGVAVLFLLWLVVSGIYSAGYGKAKAEGDAALAALKQEYSDLSAGRWAEHAEKEREARVRLEKEQARANALEADLLKTKSALTAERRGFAKRIANATRNNDCPLNADTVRLYNEALYGPHAAAGAGAGSKDSTGGAAGIAAHSPAAAPLGAGLLQQQSVTMKDLLAHAKLYGEWAREVYGIAQGWNALLPE